MKHSKNFIHSLPNINLHPRRWDIRQYLKWIILFAGLFIVNCRLSVADDCMFQLVIPPPPEPEASGARLYSDSNGQIIITYDLGRTENDKEYFWNGHLLFGLSDTEAYAIANTPGLVQKIAGGHGLTQLNTIFGTTNVGDTFLNVADIDAEFCRWPYNGTLVIRNKNGKTVRLMFFRHRPMPSKDHYRLYCEGGPGDVDITTQYVNVTPLIYLDKRGSVLLFFERPPIVMRFNENGSKICPQITSDTIVVPADLSDRFYKKVAEGEMRAQEAVDSIERELNRVSNETN